MYEMRKKVYHTLRVSALITSKHVTSKKMWLRSEFTSIMVKYVCIQGGIWSCFYKVAHNNLWSACWV